MCYAAGVAEGLMSYATAAAYAQAQKEKESAFMKGIRVFSIILGLLTIFPLSTYAQRYGKWEKKNITNKFGDSTGGFIYRQIISGSGSSSSQSNEPQMIIIAYNQQESVLIFLIKETGTFSFPLNMYVWRTEPITLYLKDSAGKTYSFDGIQVESSDGFMEMGINHPAESLVSLLKKNGSYKAVIKGKRWSCSFSFNGGMP